MGFSAGEFLITAIRLFIGCHRIILSLRFYQYLVVYCYCKYVILLNLCSIIVNIASRMVTFITGYYVDFVEARTI